MNEAMIANWNLDVSPQDIVYHLGDVAFGDHRRWTDRLNGTIWFVRGNHDLIENDPAIANWPHIMTLKRIDRVGRVVLCHYPIEEWDGWYAGSIHLHAHTHSKQFVSAERRFNVGVDANEFRPVSLDVILDHQNSVKK
jgi:calcineurin-like phosphoesterase family protein